MMSAWPGKYVIGLTGNIATGKSVVRKMLEHLGAYGIDADALSHRAIAKGAPGYKPAVEMFGKWILGPDGQIDRDHLGRVVFSDAEALEELEKIVHPLVGQAVDIMVRRARQPVIVIEAIKLVESDLRKKCDSLWVAYAPQEVQLARLMQKRGMDEATARQRILSQAPPEAKTSIADVVIRNVGSFEETWKQVATAWNKLFPAKESAPAVTQELKKRGRLEVRRAGPRQAAEIAILVNRLARGKRNINRDDVMASFGEKAFLILNSNGKPAGLAGLKVENLVARTDDVYLDPSIPFATGLSALTKEIERISSELQCEISLLFLPPSIARQEASIRHLGYQFRTPESLGIRAWQEAAIESMPKGMVMLFKQLRQDRVLRPV
ncbi:MAG: dephospho-CoA kinase [Anaerolineales bacterium]